MKQIGIAFFEALGKIGVAYIVAACLVGADTLIPHKRIKYIYVDKKDKKGE